MRLHSLIIPVYNHASLTRQLLNRLVTELSPAAQPEIIIVDDASTDGTPSLLQNYHPRIRVLTHRKNLGFAASCNDGAALAEGRYLIFLNNDTLPQGDWLGELIHYAECHPRAAVVGSKLLFSNGTIQHAGVIIGQDGAPHHIYAGFPHDHPAVNKSRRFQIVSAGCALVRREAFERVGGFDTSFINGAEDVDLCLRLGEWGYEIHYCHTSVLYHLESVSEGRFAHDAHNARLLTSRWQGKLQPDDLRYYLEDGLLRIDYSSVSHDMLYPLEMQISPLLANVAPRQGAQEAGRLVRERTQQVYDLLRENAHLKAELAQATNGTTSVPEITIKPTDHSLLSSSKLPLSAIALDPRELPLPPQELMFRVAGTEDAKWFLESGRLGLADLEAALAHTNQSLSDFHEVYDFGCGCGRLLRWLVARVPTANMTGSDIDRAAVEWVRDNMAWVDARVNDGLPPLPFEADSFDLVIGLSVFTHLPEDYQDAWLEELHRVTRPGATLLLTVHGIWNWKLTREGALAAVPEAAQLQTELERDGFLHWRGDGWGNYFPDFYHTSWHLPEYIRRHWSRWFVVRDILEGKLLSNHDIVILTRE